MLTELRSVARELRKSGVPFEIRHPDIKDARRIPTALVRLDASGIPTSVYSLPRETRCWTLRDGQQNSFPFVQFKAGLRTVPPDSSTAPRDPAARRTWLLDLVGTSALATAYADEWPARGLLERLRERRSELRALENDRGSVMLDTLDRFLTATTPPSGGATLLDRVAQALVRAIQQSADPAIAEVAEGLLVRGDAAMMFDTDGPESVLDPMTVRGVSDALGAHTSSPVAHAGPPLRCSLTGEHVPLVSGPFPQPNLPLIGQTFVFARNADIPANSRYRRSAAASIPVGIDAANEISAAISAITEQQRRNITWRPIPAEVPGDTDLLIAFAQGELEAPVAASLAGDDADDDFDDRPSAAATFQIRAQRVIDAVRAHVGSDFETTRLKLLIIRQVDPANRKVIYSGTPSVRQLKAAAQEWAAGSAALPSWLALRVRQRTTRLIVDAEPRAFAPLRLVAMSRSIFLTDGSRATEAPGLPAAEVLRLFLDTPERGQRRDPSLARRVLHLLLARRRHLLTLAARERWRSGAFRERDALVNNLNPETLRTASALGVLLTKLNRAERYMDDSPFKLGQLLAAADGVHAGYCADVRGGDLPPSLLGNQVLTMAQTAPTRALAVLSSRWRPYKAWADRIDIGPGKSKYVRWTQDGDREYKWRGWAVMNALKYNRAMRTLADELNANPLTDRPDDTFRAELLLGYLSGVPLKSSQSSAAVSDSSENSSTGDE